MVRGPVARSAACVLSTHPGAARVQVAVVATARKMTVLAWHLITSEQDYAFARPSLVADKRRKLELAAGAPSGRGSNRGAVTRTT